MSETLEQIALLKASDAYDLIDRYLRNNLDDADYQEYSHALQEVWDYAAPVVKEGWQMVPKEPTKTQVRSGQLGVTTTCAIAIYKAMIAAAPELEDL